MNESPNKILETYRIFAAKVGKTRNGFLMSRDHLEQLKDSCIGKPVCTGEFLKKQVGTIEFSEIVGDSLFIEFKARPNLEITYSYIGFQTETKVSFVEADIGGWIKKGKN
jgi:hypothetical protein